MQRETEGRGYQLPAHSHGATKAELCLAEERLEAERNHHLLISGRELACYNSCRCDSLLAKPLAALHAVRGAADAFFPSFRPEPSCKLQTSSLVTQLLAGCFMPNSHPFRVSQLVTHLNAPRNNS